MNAVPSKRILMLLENGCFPEDSRVLLEAESLVSAGFHVTVISPDSKTRRRKWERLGSVQVYRYPRPMELNGVAGYILEYGYSIVMQFAIACFVFIRHGFDAIHMHTPPDLNAVIPIFFKIFGKKFVYDLHDLSPELFQAQRNNQGSQWIYRVLRGFERLASRNATRLIATNETQRSIQIDRCGAKADHCYVVRNGPNQAFLSTVEPLPELRTPGRLNIGYVGVIGIQDGVDYLIRALHELLVQRGRSDFQAIIVGGGSALKDIRHLADELGLSNHIRFTGMIPFVEVPRYIASFDICSTPDPSNPYNNSCTTIKTMEYMALGKPTVCFETSENIRTAGEAALYAKNNEIVDYAHQMERLLDDPELRNRLGKVGRSRIDDGLTWWHQSKKLVEAYDDMFAIKRTVTIQDPNAKQKDEHSPSQNSFRIDQSIPPQTENAITPASRERVGG